MSASGEAYLVGDVWSIVGWIFAMLTEEIVVLVRVEEFVILSYFGQFKVGTLQDEIDGVFLCGIGGSLDLLIWSFNAPQGGIVLDGWRVSVSFHVGFRAK